MAGLTFAIGAATGIAAVLTVAYKKIQQIIGNASSGFTSLDGLEFSGMSEAGLDELDAAIEELVGTLEDKIYEFSDAGQFDSSFVGQCRGAVDDYLNSIIKLLQAYISQLRRSQEDMHTAYSTYKESVEALANNAQNDANDIIGVSNDIKNNTEKNANTSGGTSNTTPVSASVSSGIDGTSTPSTDDELGLMSILSEDDTDTDNPSGNTGGNGNNGTGGNSTGGNGTGGGGTGGNGGSGGNGNGGNGTGGNGGSNVGNGGSGGNNGGNTGNGGSNGNNNGVANFSGGTGKGGNSAFTNGTTGADFVDTLGDYEWESMNPTSLSPGEELTNLVNDGVEVLDVDDFKNVANMAKTLDKSDDTGLSKGAIIGLAAGATALGGGAAAAFGIKKHNENVEEEKATDKINLTPDEYFEKYGYREGTRFDQ